MSGQAASAPGASAPCLRSSADLATALQSRAAATTRGTANGVMAEVIFVWYMIYARLWWMGVLTMSEFLAFARVDIGCFIGSMEDMEGK